MIEKYTVNIFQHQSFCIYLLFGPSNMDFGGHNFGLQFARVALVDSEGNCPGVGRLSGGNCPWVNYPGEQLSRGQLSEEKLSARQLSCSDFIYTSNPLFGNNDSFSKNLLVFF